MTNKLAPTILVVEDDETISSVIKYNLSKVGFNVTVLNTGNGAHEKILSLKPDLIILDWMIPGASGIEICDEVRKTPSIKNTPIIMLSSRGEELDKVTGLETGADDYLTKPFSSTELIARINAILRRIRPAFAGEKIQFKDIELDLEAHKISRGGKVLDLSPIEFKIFQLLVENPGKVFSRENLMDKIWGSDIYVGIRTVDVHITRLRKTLKEASSDGKDVIKTVRLAGYALDS